jgi:hypothetical protein
MRQNLISEKQPFRVVDPDFSVIGLPRSLRLIAKTV